MGHHHHHPLPAPFLAKKRRILAALSTPLEAYHDASPKDSVDVRIRDLIEEINGVERWVTTSSCAGRVSVFLEGSREAPLSEAQGEEGRTVAKIGGKGGGGRWLFVSHDPVAISESMDIAKLLGMVREGGSSESGAGGSKRRFVHFKFEPMILHVLTASLAHAQTLLTAALAAGFRESGAQGLVSAAGGEAACPMVAVRSMGLGLESLVGYWDEERGECVCDVGEGTLRTLMGIAGERFEENERRIGRFREGLRMVGASEKEERRGDGEDGVWEDAKARGERKRREGLERKKREDLERSKERIEVAVDVSGLEILEGES